MADAEMLRTFNAGIGFVVVVPQSDVARALAAAEAAGERAWDAGVVVDVPASRAFEERVEIAP